MLGFCSPKLCISLTSLQGLWSKRVYLPQMGVTIIQGALCFMNFQVCFLKGVCATKLKFYCTANLLFLLMSAKATHKVMYYDLTPPLLRKYFVHLFSTLNKSFCLFPQCFVSLWLLNTTHISSEGQGVAIKWYATMGWWMLLKTINRI